MSVKSIRDDWSTTVCSRAQHVVKRQASNFCQGFFLHSVPVFRHICHDLKNPLVRSSPCNVSSTFDFFVGTAGGGGGGGGGGELN